MRVTREVGFEDAIADRLVANGGYTPGVPTNYDPAVALDTAELFAFIGATQAASGLNPHLEAKYAANRLTQGWGG